MRTPTVGRKLYSVLMFVLVSALGGVLVAGLAVPTAGVGAELAKVSATALQALPKEIETPPPAEGSQVLMADGSVLTNFFDENRAYVPLSEISDEMKQAQLSVEDQRFYRHGALDLRGTLRALVRTSSGNLQGGSTLTQQYVKLALIDKAVADNDEEALSAAYDRTFARKLLELRYAIALEEKLTKDEILERYLNLSYYGAGAYGVEAAAKRYFNTTAKELDLQQAALLAGLVRNPATTDPIDNEKIALERRNNVLDVMLAQASTPDVWHFIPPVTRTQVEEAKAQGFDRSLITKTPHGCAASEFQHLCWTVWETLRSDAMASLGPDSASRERAVKRGGLTIQTEIDPRTQRAAQEAVSNFIYPTDPVLGVMVMVEPGTGLIKAAAQSRPVLGDDPGETWWNYAMDPGHGGNEGYFGGSTYKVFTLAAAIAKGIPTSRTFGSPKTRVWGGERFRTCDGWYRATPRDWTVRNAGGAGEFNMYTGTKHSVNNYFMALEQQVGLCDTVQMAEKLGLRITSKSWEQAQVASFTLGAEESSPISLANAYATLAARGMRCDTIILKSVVGKDGKNYEVPNANCQQVIPQEVADRVNDVMRGPFNGGTASSANIRGYNIAGKTGTDTGAPTIWTVGYTPQLVGAAMITVDKKAARYDQPRYKGKNARPRSLVGAPIRDGAARLRGSSGGEAGARIWKPAMSVALEGLERGNFVKPTKYTPPTVDVPSCSGMGLNECRQVLQDAGFGTSIRRVENSRPAGTFLGITPRNRAQQYSTIRLQVSSGPAPKPKPKPQPQPTQAPDPAPEQPAEPPAEQPAENQ